MQKKYPNLYIRSIQPADQSSVVLLYKKGWLETYPNEAYDITTASIEKVVAEFSETSIHKNKFVAEISGKVCGVISIKEGDIYTIQSLYVLQAYQGQGIGTQLLEFVIKKFGNTTYELRVADYNHQAINFYKKFGFKLVVNSQSIFEIHKLKIPQITMRKLPTK